MAHHCEQQIISEDRTIVLYLESEYTLTSSCVMVFAYRLYGISIMNAVAIEMFRSALRI